MPLKTEEVDEPDLNLTPMIDIVMLLIIFFMVGTKFSEDERQFDIKLPTVSEAQPLTSRPDEITVNIDRKGNVYVGGEPFQLNELSAEMDRIKKNYEDQVVIIRGDGQGQYQMVMDVLSICKKAGIKNIQLANRLKDPES